jgi:hypothetical protein
MGDIRVKEEAQLVQLLALLQLLQLVMSKEQSLHRFEEFIY